MRDAVLEQSAFSSTKLQSLPTFTVDGHAYFSTLWGVSIRLLAESGFL